MSNCNGYSNNKLEIFQKLLLTHQEKVKIFNSIIDSNTKQCENIKKIGELEKKLKNLKNSGPQFKNFLSVINDKTSNKISYFDKIVPILT